MDDLQRAISAIRSGHKATGRQLLAQFLLTNPRNETAWLWMAWVIDTQKRRRDCLEQVLILNPDHQAARRGLEALVREQAARQGEPPTLPQPSESIPSLDTQPAGLSEGITSQLRRLRSAPGQRRPAAQIRVLRGWRAIALGVLAIVVTLAALWLRGRPLSLEGDSAPASNPGQSAHDEPDYSAYIVQISLTYAQALNVLSERMNAASDDAQLLFDTTWQNDLLTTAAILKANGEAVRQLQPPARFSGVHQDLRTAASHFDQVADLVTGFALDQDLSKLEQAAIEMQSGKDATERASQKLEELENRE
jgi:hypothetical protein